MRLALKPLATAVLKFRIEITSAYFSWYCVLNKPNPLSGIRVVLSHTTHPGNIGAAARAMKTMGLRHLYLINPRHFPDAQATAMAAGADDVLQDAVVCGSIDEALQGVVFTVAMTARLRDISIAVRTPREAMPQVLQEAQAGPVALLFGTEMSGLTNEEMGKAQLGVNIPANPEFSSLNVAAAVQVMAYELVAAAENFVPRVPQIEPATHERLEGLYAHLEKTLFEIGFFTTQNPARLMQRLRRLYSRTRLEDEEINILRGMLTVATEYNARLKKRYAEEHPDVQQH
ncbi:tRNA (cytidine/uridine-2'-O-)-methyltransferase TrmJ [mine drainage metagenome]|uniref:tRNA (Cytidine/uridine-2'-O-)-methyltransferase TrmJ n=1 Tax=mine drainage metagenome TaxID=410659 RepID=A0A1J5TFR7_9ZZZZ